MKKLLGNLQFKFNGNSTDSCREIKWWSFFPNGTKLNSGRNMLDEKLLPAHEGLNNILKEHEQRKKSIEKLIKNFKAAGKKRFLKIKRETASANRFQIF